MKNNNDTFNIDRPNHRIRYNTFFIRFLIVVISMSACIYVGQAILNYRGFCISEGRWLNDDEIINMQITRVNERSSAVLPNEDGRYISHKIIPYKDIEEFIRKNPDCCKLGEYIGEGFPSHFRMRIAGELKGTIGVHYMLHYINEAGSILLKKEDIYLGFNNCGHRPKIERFE